MEKQWSELTIAEKVERLSHSVNHLLFALQSVSEENEKLKARVESLEAADKDRRDP